MFWLERKRRIFYPKFCSVEEVWNRVCRMHMGLELRGVEVKEGLIFNWHRVRHYIVLEELMCRAMLLVGLYFACGLMIMVMFHLAV